MAARPATRLTGEQRRIARVFIEEGLRVGAPRKYMKAILEAGLVESGLRNLPGGMDDSAGPLQQRPSQGWGTRTQVRNPRRAARKFYAVARRVDRPGMSAGRLAQAVQRSAFPGRYARRSGEAGRILRGTLRRGAPGGGAVTRVTSRRVSRRVLDLTRRLGALPGLEQSPPPQARPVLSAALAGVKTLDPRPAVVRDLQVQPSAPAAVSVRDQLRRIERQRLRRIERQITTTTTSRRASGGRRAAGGGLGDIVRFSREAQAAGLVTTSGKRARKLTSAGRVSDHWIGNRAATARDWSGSPQAMARFARRVARELGIRGYRPGAIRNVTRGGYRYQLIFGTPDHMDHVHLGIRRVR